MGERIETGDQRGRHCANRKTQHGIKRPLVFLYRSCIGLAALESQWLGDGRLEGHPSLLLCHGRR